ncbi:MAG: cyclohexanecarboxylate-CoA ligase [Actinomycetota bacterium]|jgi:acyl-coenzyme A synthetase/AMP-(fatty) acid ligase|nr:cyclohexanecarboxylate-CoA ligase [Actinomycetota bacterium]
MRDVVTTDDRRSAYARAGFWDETTLAGRVRAHADADADRVAVVDDAGARSHTYGQLADHAERLAGHLLGAGVATGDVVSIQLPNVYEAAVAAVACQRIGAVINPLLPNYRHKELSHIWTTATPAAVLTPSTHRGFDYCAMVAGLRASTGLDPHHVVVGGPGGDVSFEDAVDADGGRLPALAPDAAAISELIFTSGTEATPKAIMHSEQTTNFSVRVAYADLGLTPDDVVWMPSPVGHSTGFNYGLRFALYHGLTLVLQDAWDASVAVGLIEDHDCSYTLAATTFLKELTELAHDTGSTLPTMRTFGCGGAPVPAELVESAARVGINVLRLYGSTEVLVGTWNRNDSPPDARVGTDGIAMSHVEVMTVGEDGEPCGPGQPGEIYTRGPNTCLGFFDDPERTQATFTADGWVRSGDLAVIDDRGYLTVVGRKKEIIIRGGINIAPMEIEELLLQFPEVDRVAVVGIPDERLGERMCACVVTRPGTSLDFETMVARLRATGLATYKLPERLELLPALPMTASGKVQKHEILRQLEGANGAG